MKRKLQRITEITKNEIKTGEKCRHLSTNIRESLGYTLRN